MASFRHAVPPLASAVGVETRYMRTGSAMFFRVCAPRSSKFKPDFAADLTEDDLRHEH